MKQKSGKHCTYVIEQVSSKVSPWRSIYIQLCSTAPPATNAEDSGILTRSTENCRICWKGGAEGKGESVIVYSHVFSNRG